MESYSKEYQLAILEQELAWFHYETEPSPIGLHEHDFHEVYIHFTGEVEYRAAGSLFTLQPGSVMLIPAGVLHQPLFLSPKTYNRLVLWLHPGYPRRLSTLQTSLGACFTHGATLLNPGTQPAQQIMQLLQQWPADNAYGADIRKTALAQELLLQLNELICNPDIPFQPSSQDGHYGELAAYINRNFAQPLTLQQLADRCYLSKYHLLREFKHHYGVTLHRYIVMTRLANAKRLLLQGLSFTAVATQCGFNDYSSFLAAFKREYSVTPRAFTQMMERSTQRIANGEL